MQYRHLGRSGLKLSVFSLGSWVTFAKQVDNAAAKQMLKTAFEAGINFFDNAEAYEDGESETIMGAALRQLNLPRDEYCVSSKVFWGGSKPTQLGLSAKHIYDACHAALRRLQVDYLDLYFCHRPDLHTPLEETVRAMHNLVTQGKVLYWGTSEWSAQQISAAHGIARRYFLTPPTMEQPQYNLFERRRVEHDLVPLYTTIGLGTTIWSPLASGILTGKYNASLDAKGRLNLPGYEWLKKEWQSDKYQSRWAKVKRLSDLAATLDMPLHHLALAWCLHNPHVSTVILGASKMEQLKDNLTAVNALQKLEDHVIEQIEMIMQNKPSPPLDWKEY